jgi:hypothetical protein
VTEKSVAMAVQSQVQDAPSSEHPLRSRFNAVIFHVMDGYMHRKYTELKSRPSIRQGDPTMRKQLVGTWKLVSAEACQSNGNVIRVYGENPRGVIMYDAAGNVSVNLMRTDRPAFCAADKAKSTSGSDQLRFYEFSDDHLILSTAEIPYGGATVVGRLIWKRVAPQGV